MRRIHDASRRVLLTFVLLFVIGGVLKCQGLVEAIEDLNCPSASQITGVDAAALQKLFFTYFANRVDYHQQLFLKEAASKSSSPPTASTVGESTKQAYHAAKSDYERCRTQFIKDVEEAKKQQPVRPRVASSSSSSSSSSGESTITGESVLAALASTAASARPLDELLVVLLNAIFSPTVHTIPAAPGAPPRVTMSVPTAEVVKLRASKLMALATRQRLPQGQAPQSSTSSSTSLLEDINEEIRSDETLSTLKGVSASTIAELAASLYASRKDAAALAPAVQLLRQVLKSLPPSPSASHASSLSSSSASSSSYQHVCVGDAARNRSGLCVTPAAGPVLRRLIVQAIDGAARKGTAVGESAGQAADPFSKLLSGLTGGAGAGAGIGLESLLGLGLSMGVEMDGAGGQSKGAMMVSMLLGQGNRELDLLLLDLFRAAIDAVTEAAGMAAKYTNRIKVPTTTNTAKAAVATPISPTTTRGAVDVDADADAIARGLSADEARRLREAGKSLPSSSSPPSSASSSSLSSQAGVSAPISTAPPSRVPHTGKPANPDSLEAHTVVLDEDTTPTSSSSPPSSFKLRVGRGFMVIDGYLGPAPASAVRRDVRALASAGLLLPTKTALGHVDSIRGDHALAVTLPPAELMEAAELDADGTAAAATSASGSKDGSMTRSTRLCMGVASDPRERPPPNLSLMHEAFEALTQPQRQLHHHHNSQQHQQQQQSKPLPWPLRKALATSLGQPFPRAAHCPWGLREAFRDERASVVRVLDHPQLFEALALLLGSIPVSALPAESVFSAGLVPARHSALRCALRHLTRLSADLAYILPTPPLPTASASPSALAEYVSCAPSPLCLALKHTLTALHAPAPLGQGIGVDGRPLHHDIAAFERVKGQEVLLGDIPSYLKDIPFQHKTAHCDGPPSSSSSSASAGRCDLSAAPVNALRQAPAPAISSMQQQQQQQQQQQSQRATVTLNVTATEFVVTRYPATGARYITHFDESPRLRTTAPRLFSFIYYLNPGWSRGDGGELRLHIGGGETVDVAPLSDRLVVFPSQYMPHEVLPSSVERFAVTGWFRAASFTPDPATTLA